MTLDEYNRLQHERSKIDGFGANVTITSPCPACCAPNFVTYLAMDTEKRSGVETVCAACGRGFMYLMRHHAGGTEIEMVQTRGPDPDLPFLPKMRRVEPPPVPSPGPPQVH